MALVIEDGTGKPDATSYATVEETRAYATARGVTLPATDAAVEALLIPAMDYLEAQRSRYQGKKAHPGVQALQWPRTGVVLDCEEEFPDDAIPSELKRAQMQCAIELHRGLNPLAGNDGRVKKKTKVDVIETEYFSSTELGESGVPTASLPAVDALLEPLFFSCGPTFLRAVRV